MNQMTLDWKGPIPLKEFCINEFLSEKYKFPNGAGIYLWWNKKNEEIDYIGRSIELSERLRMEAMRLVAGIDPIHKDFVMNLAFNQDDMHPGHYKLLSKKRSFYQSKKILITSYFQTRELSAYKKLASLIEKLLKYIIGLIAAVLIKKLQALENLE